MSITIKNIKEIEGKSFIIRGLPQAINIKDGSTMFVVWANDTHVELKSTGGSRVCLRTHIALNLLNYK
jgi:hypothetical protein